MSEPRREAAGSWLAFGSLALYASLRWGTMLGPSALGSLVESLGVALLTAWGLRWLLSGQHRRWGCGPLVVVALGTMFIVAGVPVRTVVGLHLGRLRVILDHGIAAVPNVLVPYRGDDSAVAAVLVLGAAALLLCAAVAFGTVRRRPGTGRLALAALPLLVLAIVPSAIVRPRLVYFHGLLTFGLVVLLVLSPRLTARRRGGAITLIAVSAVLGAVGSGLLIGDHLWVQVATAHGGPGGDGSGQALSADSFNWQQSYGDQGWPHDGATVLTVTARRPAYWKAEDLDTFTGVRWTTGRSSGNGLAGVSRVHIAAYSEQLTVDIEQMYSSQVITAGYADSPGVVGVAPGADPGSWITTFALRAGDQYQVRVYAPDPSPAQLATAGRSYPGALAPFRTPGPLPSAYAPVEALSRQLAARATTPYEYLEAVLDYLHSGFVYTLTPPTGGTFPLVDFLLHSRRGYCQQFAGATALLMRMQGIPARVAVGFSPGTRRGHSHTYAVSDRNAHAWVEVWFPSYGWVTVDPTPGQPRSGAATTTAVPAAVVAASTTGADTGTGTGSAPARTGSTGHSGRLAHGLGGGADGSPAQRHRHGVPVVTVLLAILGLVALTAGCGLAWTYWRRPSPAELTAELERAFARRGTPLTADVTLAALADRLSDSPRAAAYVASLAASRYGPQAGSVPPGGRAALRRRLARGTGPRGWLTAIWALPPRRPGA